VLDLDILMNRLKNLLALLFHSVSPRPDAVESYPRWIFPVESELVRGRLYILHASFFFINGLLLWQLVKTVNYGDLLNLVTDAHLRRLRSAETCIRLLSVGRGQNFAMKRSVQLDLESAAICRRTSDSSTSHAGFYRLAETAACQSQRPCSFICSVGPKRSV